MEMVKAPPKKAATTALNRGAWTSEEDKKLVDYVRLHGNHNWRTLPQKAGLKRCSKSCRLRWLNYLRPNIKRGNITEDEEELIIRLHNLLGNKWSLIAGRLPGRTDNEIKNYWNAHLKKRALSTDDLNRKLFINPNFLRQPLGVNDSTAVVALSRPLPVRLPQRQKCPNCCATQDARITAHEDGVPVPASAMLAVAGTSEISPAKQVCTPEMIGDHEMFNEMADMLDWVDHMDPLAGTGSDEDVRAKEKASGGSSSSDVLSALEFDEPDKIISCEIRDDLASWLML